MKRSRPILLLLINLVLFGFVTRGYFYYKEHKIELAAIQQAKIDARVAQIKTRQPAQSSSENTTPQRDIAMDEAVPKSYPRPISAWQVTEKSLYQKLLSAGKFEVLVVPFQVQDYALDRPTRSLMTAELAMLISQAENVKIPDPYLVARALGEGKRRLDND